MYYVLNIKNDEIYHESYPEATCEYCLDEPDVVWFMVVFYKY